MASRFIHRQDSLTSYTSICNTCSRSVAMRDRESELRTDEEAHSCRILPPDTKPDTAYWGIRCRSCSKLVAFGSRLPQRHEPGDESSRPGTIHCAQGHVHIYFPHDFCFFLSEVAIPDAVLQKNLDTYKTINPFRESSSEPLRTPPYALANRYGFASVKDGHAVANPLPARLSPNPDREAAAKAAKAIWEVWGRKKRQ